MKESANKFLISPWDPAHGAFPAGKKYALSHWAADVDQATGKVGAPDGSPSAVRRTQHDRRRGLRQEVPVELCPGARRRLSPPPFASQPPVTTGGWVRVQRVTLPS